ncbi:MAG: histidinol phosphate phosphatase domain-containing protein [Actinobacteria bacterium]|nr:histidinol phosphate phosphatase domain-containing protein [Actinomycetota bacterium]
MICDFHTHTVLSDGESIPIEVIRFSHVRGYRVIALTDHVSASNMTRVIDELKRDCSIAVKNWDILAIPGVEISNVPRNEVKGLAKKAKELGARIVVMHGESPIEKVEPGTNYEAVTCEHVDLLAHPGLITEEELRLAKSNGIFIELSSRKGHSMGNGHVAKYGLKIGVNFLVNSDSHKEDDMLVEGEQEKVILCAGLDKSLIHTITVENPNLLLKKLGY